MPWFRWLKSRTVPLGLRGERYAAKWLKRQGMKIVAGGSRSRYGEIDIVAVDGQTVVFVEVKTRASDAGGSPAEAVDGKKQQHLVQSALAFLKMHNLLEYRARFDVVALTWPEGARKPVVQYVPNAFEPQGRGQFFR